jgi:hypothetical protein
MSHITVFYIHHFDVRVAVFALNQESKISCSATTGPVVQDIYFQSYRSLSAFQNVHKDICIKTISAIFIVSKYC